MYKRMLIRLMSATLRLYLANIFQIHTLTGLSVSLNCREIKQYILFNAKRNVLSVPSPETFDYVCAELYISGRISLRYKLRAFSIS